MSHRGNRVGRIHGARKFSEPTSGGAIHRSGWPRFRNPESEKEITMLRDVSIVVALGTCLFLAGAGAALADRTHQGSRSAAALANASDSELEAASDVPSKKCSGNHADDEAQRRPKSDFRRLYELNLTAAADHGRDQILPFV